MGAKVRAKSVADYRQRLAPHLDAIVSSVRATVLECYPAAEERLAWAGIGYKDGNNYICVVYRGKQGMNVMLYRGAMLRDRRGVLEGTGHSTRNLPIRTPADRHGEALAELLRQQKALYASGVRWEG